MQIPCGAAPDKVEVGWHVDELPAAPPRFLDARPRHLRSSGRHVHCMTPRGTLQHSSGQRALCVAQGTGLAAWEQSTERSCMARVQGVRPSERVQSGPPAGGACCPATCLAEVLEPRVRLARQARARRRRRQPFKHLPHLQAGEGGR